jgi:PAS domain S-box-containing protein
MLEHLADWFSTDLFMPHGMCLVWRPDLIWLHVVSDALIALSYFSIPFALVYFVRKRADLAYPWMFLLFAVFILACGTTHLFAVWTMWYPDYVWQGLVKAATAAVSVASAVLLWPLIPKALAIPSPAQLASANTQLRESEEKLTVILATINNIVWSVAADTYKTLYLNPAAERIYGRTASAFYADPELFLNIVHPEDRPRVAQMLPEMIEKGTVTIQYRVVRPDGEVRWLEDTAAIVRDAGGRPVRFNGVASDITERKCLAAEVEYRSTMLHAVSVAAKELLTAATIEDAMANALKTMGEAAQADRALVFENETPPGGGLTFELRYSWHSAKAPVIVNAALVGNVHEVHADPWFAPLGEGQVVTALVQAMPDGAAKTLFISLGIQSILMTPMTIEGKLWGSISFDDCTTTREWTSVEVDILRTLADIIGSSIIRERYVEQLRDANTIVERSQTILFRLRGDPSLPLAFISHNVTMYGYDPAEMVASPQFYQTLIHPDDALRILELLAQVVMEGSEPAAVEFRMRASDGIYHWLECHYTPIRDAASRPRH